MYEIKTALAFSPEGKLEKLCLSGYPNVLHEWDQGIDLGGKYFRPAGWDECFPTIDAYGTSAVMGDLIGMTPEINWQARSVEQIWRCTGFIAQRRFSLETASCMGVSFHVTNLQNNPVEYLWASHALFSVSRLQKIRLANGLEYANFAMNNSVEKSFQANCGAVEFVYPDHRMFLTSDQPWWGIWINRGGWPEDHAHSFCCLGVEATNTASEQPDGQWLLANRTFTGTVKLEFQPD